MNAQPVSYTFPERALRRWAQKHLTLTKSGDMLKALFRFEGSTCGNIPFFLDYIVRLDRADGVARIRDLSCSPAPGDEGHRQMCLAKSDLDELLRTLRDEQPLVGEPLDRALAWHPETEPAGCVCSSTFRNHKWRAVLETIHYALTQPGAETNNRLNLNLP